MKILYKNNPVALPRPIRRLRITLKPVADVQQSLCVLSMLESDWLARTARDASLLASQARREAEERRKREEEARARYGAD